MSSKPLSGHVIKDSAPVRLARPTVPGIAQPRTPENPTVALDSRQFVLQDEKTVVPANVDSAEFNKLFKSSATTTVAPKQQKKPAAIPAKSDNTSLKGYNDDPNTLQGQLSIISKYDVVLVLDRSGSMATPDCDGGQSRWEWCKQQTERFSDVTSSALPDGFDLLLFTMSFEDEGKQNLSTLSEVFNKQHPGGSTMMSGVLNYSFQQYLQRRDQGSQKPLIIAVITDGLPYDSDQIGKTIIAMTHRMHTFDEVKITFLKVGNAAEGDSFMRAMDDGLLAQGAAYDIVDSKSFDELHQCGLLKALIDAITEKR